MLEFSPMPARYWSRRLRSVLIWASSRPFFHQTGLPEVGGEQVDSFLGYHDFAGPDLLDLAEPDVAERLLHELDGPDGRAAR